MLMQLEMYQQQQQPVTVLLNTAAGQTVTFASNSYESYNSRKSMLSGIILITTGVFSVLFNVVGFFRMENVSFIGHGIWCGIPVSKICCILYLYLFAYSVNT